VSYVVQVDQKSPTVTVTLLKHIVNISTANIVLRKNCYQIAVDPKFQSASVAWTFDLFAQI